MESDIQVLAVDDIQLMCHFVYEAVMDLKGFNCITASDYYTSEALLQSNPVDIAILDIKLRDGSGLELAKNIRKGKYNCKNDIPIFIFTGNAYQKEIADCMKYDINSVLVKPCNLSTIQKRVQANRKQLIKVSSPDHYLVMAELEKEEEQRKKAALEMEEQKQALMRINAKSGNSYRANGTSSFVTKESSGHSVFKDRIIKNKKKHAEPQILSWPKGRSTGYFQLDRRLKSIEYNINALYALKGSISNRQAAVAEVEKIRQTLDNIEFIASKLRKSYPTDCLWDVLFRLLKHFKEIPIESLVSRNSSGASPGLDVIALIEDAWENILKETKNRSLNSG
ncbi:hypothetical protein tinsulaeT_30610 [Thalassotalea insulae]|uniref:Response regulatory domain-containing protein n=1 Tax=Thalassotalea insulae TaxID=2056778 RepID=A0ABQ6GUV3_9GAMM|nr:response regulator [Thalassotalea insulae]GLX79721.1 hypothetical protein tinsulaeT_30610 [Thalassotalea insulae]